MAVDELEGFESCAFELRDSLHLLAHDLVGLPVSTPPEGITLRKGNRLRLSTATGRRPLLQPFWRLDEEGLREALDGDDRGAVPRRLVRVAAGGRAVGYAVTGLTADMGYLQRLAVDPDVEGRGVGRALVLDGLTWLVSNGAHQAVVNTQVENTRALGLYRSVGFRPAALRVVGPRPEPSKVTMLPETAPPETAPPATVGTSSPIPGGRPDEAARRHRGLVLGAWSASSSACRRRRARPSAAADATGTTLRLVSSRRGRRPANR